MSWDLQIQTNKQTKTNGRWKTNHINNFTHESNGRDCQPGYKTRLNYTYCLQEACFRIKDTYGGNAKD